MGNACISGTPVFVRGSVHAPVTSVEHVSESSSSRAGTHSDKSPFPSALSNAESGVFMDQQDKGDVEPSWVSTAAGPPAPSPTPVDPKLPGLAALPQAAAMLVCGRVYSCPLPLNKVVYIVHCGTFTDCHVERNYMFKHVYSDIRDFCIKNGRELVVYDLQLDLQLDFPSEFVYGHVMKKFADYVMTNLSPQENNSFLTVFLNEKYGVYWCPPKIEAEVFLDILNKVTDMDKQFLLSWYTLDDSNHAPCYVINHVNDWLPVHGSEKPEDVSANAREWEKHSIRMKNILAQTAPAEFQKNNCISIIEQQLQDFVFSDALPKDKVIWLKRNFSDMEFQSEASVAKYYVDLCGSSINKIALDKLTQLGKKLTNHLHGTNRLERNVQWHQGGLDPDEKLHKQYLIELASSYKSALRNSLDGLFNTKDELVILSRSSEHSGLTRHLFQELTEHSRICITFSERFSGHPTELTILQQYLRDGSANGKSTGESAIHPLILHGAEGSGKSFLAAKMATTSCRVEGWTMSVCVMRFLTGSSHFTNQEQVVTSLREQLCLMAGQSPKDSTLNISDLLMKTPEDTPLLLIIDGLNKLPTTDNDVDVSWIPQSLPSHVRVVVTVTSDTKHSHAIKNYLQSKATYIELKPQIGEFINDLLKSHLEMERGIDLDNIQKHLTAKVGQGGLSHLNISLLAVLLTEDMLETEKHQDVFGISDEELIETFLELFEHRFHPTCVARLFGYLASSRYGLSESEILDALQLDKDVKEEFGSNVRVMSLYLWLFVQKCLRNILLVQRRHGFPVYSINFSSINSAIAKRYATQLETCETNLLTYFEWENNKDLSDNSKGKKSPGCVVKQASLRSHFLRYGHFINGRKMDEVPWLLYKQNKISNLCKTVLLNWQWIIASLELEGLYQWQLCLKLAREIAAVNSVQHVSIIFLLQLLERLAPVLSKDKEEIIAQLHLRHMSGDIEVPVVPEIIEIFRLCQKNVGPLLMPKRANSSTLRSALRNSRQEFPVTIQGLFRMRGDTDHMISLAPTKGELQVFNATTGQVLRTLKGLKTPKDVKMADSYTAVILCDRELQVYNLDDGTHISTLKGVLNLRMPYFGVHDKLHTIAMARNRMYVNMMNNITGEMVTTFKVGEDRFMDSLLTSENGCRCVCGDAVQKPFPLLVWDLNKRKLQYDLRIKGHEFQTKISAISDDGHYVVCSCKELDDPIPTFLVVYDLQSGSMFHKWKTEYSVTSVAICSRASIVLSTHTNGVLYVRNLISGVQMHELPGHSLGADVIRLDVAGIRCVTYDSTGRDSTVRLWDIVKGTCLGTFYPGFGVCCCDISPDGRAVLVGIAGVDHVLTLLPPGESMPSKSDAVFGDASRKGKVYDLSKQNA